MGRMDRIKQALAAARRAMDGLIAERFTRRRWSPPGLSRCPEEAGRGRAVSRHRGRWPQHVPPSDCPRDPSPGIRSIRSIRGPARCLGEVEMALAKPSGQDPPLPPWRSGWHPSGRKEPQMDADERGWGSNGARPSVRRAGRSQQGCLAGRRGRGWPQRFRPELFSRYLASAFLPPSHPMTRAGCGCQRAASSKTIQPLRSPASSAPVRSRPRGSVMTHPSASICVHLRLHPCSLPGPSPLGSA